jgi:DNA-directed RNA polymerase specialized sigma24 family protein
MGIRQQQRRRVQVFERIKVRYCDLLALTHDLRELLGADHPATDAAECAATLVLSAVGQAIELLPPAQRPPSSGGALTIDQAAEFMGVACSTVAKADSSREKKS